MIFITVSVLFLLPFLFFYEILISVIHLFSFLLFLLVLLLFFFVTLPPFPSSPLSSLFHNYMRKLFFQEFAPSDAELEARRNGEVCKDKFFWTFYFCLPGFKMVPSFCNTTRSNYLNKECS